MLDPALCPDRSGEMVRRAGLYLDLKPLIASDRAQCVGLFPRGVGLMGMGWCTMGVFPQTFDVSLLLYDRGGRFGEAVLAST
jgi:hypothetical protein